MKLRQVGLSAVVLALLEAAGCLSMGCQLFKPNTEPIQRKVHEVMTTVVAPAVERGLAQTSRHTAQMQGQGSLVNPGYSVSGSAGMFQGIKYDLEIRVIGVSANVAAAGSGRGNTPD